MKPAQLLFATSLLAATAAAQTPEDLDALLEPLRAKHELPALSALVLRGDEIAAQGAVGVRRIDRDVRVTDGDRWHLGSCTKSMTATLCAVLVEKEKLAWNTTVGEIFGDVENLHEEWKAVTLEHLLTNSSGAPKQLRFDGLWNRLWEREGTPVEQRRTLLEGVLTRKPDATPGTKYIYSNAGFSIAGAMAETVTSTPYEMLMQRELFDPLGMTETGFGAPGAKDAVLQPFGHYVRRGELHPRDFTMLNDNPHAIAPAGLAHATLADWARYASLHLAGARGEDGLLKAKTLEKLHAPKLNGYAMGWSVQNPEWANGPMIWHNGSNTWWYCESGLFPTDDLAILVATNTAHGTARKGSSETLEALFRYATDDDR